MHKRNVIIVIVLLAIIGIAGIALTTSAADPVPITPEAPSGEGSLNLFSTSTPVREDMEAYLRSGGSVPDPNDFNDSYSDLNQ